MHSHPNTEVNVLSLKLNLRLLWILPYLFIGISLIYVVGLEQMPYAHSAFHDLRHASGFPCH
jgi:cobalt transporter subunit CbtB